MKLFFFFGRREIKEVLAELVEVVINFGSFIMMIFELLTGVAAGEDDEAGHIDAVGGIDIVVGVADEEGLFGG